MQVALSWRMLVISGCGPCTCKGQKGCGCHPFYGSQLPSFQAKKIKVLEDSWVLQVLGSFGWKWQISRPTFGSCLVGIGVGVSQGDCGQPV